MRSLVLARVWAPCIALVFSGCYFNLDLDLGSFGRTTPLRESVVLGHDAKGPKLALIDISGLISDSPILATIGGQRPSLVAGVREALRLAEDDEDVSAVVLRIRSPGGTVAASETLYHMIREFRTTSEKPVVAYLQGLATSGGYYAAMGADEVISHPTAITGSIGVIMTGFNVAGLMERFGVEDQTFTSGPFKDSGSPLRLMRQDERAVLQGVIDDLHARFRSVVGEGRPALDPETIARLADGRIYTATQALDAGLIDAVGHLEDAVAAAETRADISDTQVIMYHRSGEFRDNVYSKASPQPAVNVIDVNLFELPGKTLPAGFYYIWPSALRAE